MITRKFMMLNADKITYLCILYIIMLQPSTKNDEMLEVIVFICLIWLPNNGDMISRHWMQTTGKFYVTPMLI